MRILVVSHYALPHIGGIEAVVAGLATEMRRRGHEVVHVASDGLSHGAVGEPPPDDGVIRVPAWNWAERKLEVPWPVFSPRLAGVLRREVARADVVHGHGALYMSTLAALAYASRTRERTPPVRVLTEHVGHVEYPAALDAVQRAAFATVGRATARSAQALVVLNDKVEADMAKIAGDRPLVRILNGVDTDTFRPATGDERAALRRELGWDDRPRVLFVGRLVAKKGVDKAIAAAQRADGAFELVLVGPGEIANPGDNVRVHGPVAPDEVAPLYRAADAFLLPSRGEGFPVTAQEAMASGLPVVLSDDPSYEPWLAGAGPAAALVEPEPDAILTRLIPLLRDPDAARAAAEHARRKFSWARAADEHEALYRKLGAN